MFVYKQGMKEVIQWLLSDEVTLMPYRWPAGSGRYHQTKTTCDKPIAYFKSKPAEQKDLDHYISSKEFLSILQEDWRGIDNIGHLNVMVGPKGTLQIIVRDYGYEQFNLEIQLKDTSAPVSTFIMKFRKYLNFAHLKFVNKSANSSDNHCLTIDCPLDELPEHSEFFNKRDFFHGLKAYGWLPISYKESNSLFEQLYAN